MMLLEAVSHQPPFCFFSPLLQRRWLIGLPSVKFKDGGRRRDLKNFFAERGVGFNALNYGRLLVYTSLFTAPSSVVFKESQLNQKTSFEKYNGECK